MLVDYGQGLDASDHADWGALLSTIAETGASRVLVTHGWSESLARFLAEERGLETGTIRTAFEGETGELTEPAEPASQAKVAEPGPPAERREPAKPAERAEPAKRAGHPHPGDKGRS